MGCGLAYCCLSAVPPVGGMDSNAVKSVLKQLDQAYGGRSVPTDLVVSNEDAKQELLAAKGQEEFQIQEWQNPAHYGELPPLGVCQLLHEVGAKQGQRLYDLGSGTGKVVALAWLLGLEATGIELIEARVQVGLRALEQLQELVPEKSNSGIRMIHGSFLDFDFSDADILYTYDLVFTPELKERIARIARRMRAGAYVISSRGLPGPGFGCPRKFYCGDLSKEIIPAEFTIQVVTG